MNFIAYQRLYKLSDQFYIDYPRNIYPEILQPRGSRVYNCLIIQNKEYYICIPFRTEMRHRNGYHFRNSERSKEHKSGLDYSKMVIVTDVSRYLAQTTSLIDSDELAEARDNSTRIARGALRYLEDYIKHVTGENILRRQDFDKKYSLSTLPYFHDLLNI